MPAEWNQKVNTTAWLFTITTVLTGTRRLGWLFPLINFPKLTWGSSFGTVQVSDWSIDSPNESLNSTFANSIYKKKEKKTKKNFWLQLGTKPTTRSCSHSHLLGWCLKTEPHWKTALTNYSSTSAKTKVNWILNRTWNFPRARTSQTNWILIQADILEVPKKFFTSPPCYARPNLLKTVRKGNRMKKIFLKNSSTYALEDLHFVFFSPFQSIYFHYLNGETIPNQLTKH